MVSKELDLKKREETFDIISEEKKTRKSQIVIFMSKLFGYAGKETFKIIRIRTKKERRIAFKQKIINQEVIILNLKFKNENKCFQN